MGINDPDFFSDESLNERAEPATPRDYGPGPNEDLDRAVQNSYSLRQDMARGITPQPGLPVVADPPVTSDSPPPPLVAPPVTGGNDVSQRMDRLEGKLDALIDALGNNQGG